MSLPEPPVPGEVDLTDFPFMPLDVRRLRDSDLATLATEAEFRAAVLLWCAAWHQVPASSLPNDERVLAAICGYGRGPAAQKDWEAVREGALRGFILCSDGRLYHPVIAEKALEALGRKHDAASRRDDHREKMRRWRAAKARKARDELGDGNGDPSRDDHGADHRDDHVTSLTGTGTGTGKGRKRAIALSSNAGASEAGVGVDGATPPAPSEGYTADFEEWWKAYPRKDGKGAAFRAYKLAKKRATPERLLEGASAYAKARAGQDPRYTKQGATWLNGDCWNDEHGNVVKLPPQPKLLPPDELRAKFERMDAESREIAKKQAEEWARYPR